MDALDMEPCACGRMDRPCALWRCRCCYMEMEIQHALSELERGGEAWPGMTWAQFGFNRLEKLVTTGYLGHYVELEP
jgi:hypothetical protein